MTETRKHARGAFNGMLYRDGKLFLASLWRALLLAVLFAAILGTVAAGTLQSLRSEGKKPLPVALVDEDNSFLSRVGIGYVSGQKNIAAILAVDGTDRAAALAGLASGDYVAAVILPEHYLNAIMAGDIVRGKILIADGVPVSGVLMKKLSRVGEDMIRMGQYGVFAGATVVAGSPDTRGIYDTYMLRINDRLIYEASTATDRYLINEETPYSTSSLPLPAHTALMGFLAFLSLSTLLFYRCQTADLTPAHAARLCASGVSGAAFLAPKLLYAFAFRTFFALLFLLCFPLVSGLSAGFFPLLGFFAALLLLCALDTLLSVALAGNRFGIALFSLLFLAELFFTGGILPLSYLSSGVRAIGTCLPLGLVKSASSPLFGGSPSPLSFLWLGLWLIPALFAALWRMKRVRTEGGREV